MPHFAEYKWILDNVFFLYPSKEDALAGTKSGGTGFLVALPSERWPTEYLHKYCITNYHVAIGSKTSGPSPVVRINRFDGSNDIIEYDVVEWQFSQGGYDLAAVPIDISDAHNVKLLVLPEWCLLKEEVKSLDIGAGEDVFMVGRFIDYDGAEVNQPSLRFGHISIMEAPIEQEGTPWAARRPSIIVDMHSRTGFSGSPVFLYINAGSIFGKPEMIMTGRHYLKLLGVLWGGFPEKWELVDKKNDVVIQGEPLQVVHGKYVQGLSDMSCVCTADSIMELLNKPKFKEMREAAEIEFAKSHMASSRSLSVS
jgi:hypothetical protein